LILDFQVWAIERFFIHSTYILDHTSPEFKQSYKYLGMASSIKHKLTPNKGFLNKLLHFGIYKRWNVKKLPKGLIYKRNMIGNSNSLKCLNYHSFIEFAKVSTSLTFVGQISHQTKQKNSQISCAGLILYFFNLILVKALPWFSTYIYNGKDIKQFVGFCA